ncbi:extracellular solute-binding protein [Paenibacillus sp. IB182496]|uniref:Extracellular solute-binding protein n=1 Tax=Paenibacillus sabuli TaxID=2772509 RepID=A0A927GT07_9BACL|nr:extracellular solute-binding protein [Paenibacillus sabuli]MBD2847113.1 extracellular solute-binding protein [Paenibacillus sabuli]
MKKRTSMMLAVVLGLCLVLAACSGGNNGNGGNGGNGGNTNGAGNDNAVNAGSGNTGGENAGSGEPLKEQTFTFLNYSNPSWPYNEDWPVWDFIKENTGVTLDVQLPSGNLLEDAVSLAIASGEMPDLMWIQTKAAADKFGQQGALVNLLDYVDQMPNFKAWMEEYPAETQHMISADGKMYMTPNGGIGETNRRTWMYREDVFTELGLQTPSTWDELYEVLQTLKAEYPDSYPLTFRSGLRNFLDFGAGFGVPAPVEVAKASVLFDQASEQWIYAPVQDDYMKMLEYFNKFYKEELIPKDFLTIDTKMWQDIVSTDRAFITLDYIGRIDFFNSALRADNPAFSMNFMPPPAGWAGGPQENAYTAVSEEGFMIASTSDKIDDIVRFLDFFYSEEGRQMVSWGKEGETYEGDAFIADYADVADLRKQTGLSTDGTYAWFDYDAHISVSSPELKTAYEQAPQYDSEKPVSVAFTPDEQQIISTKGDALNSHRDENFAKFIMGTRSFDEWGAFIEEQKKLGYEEILGIYKAAHERALAAVQ